MKEYNKDDYVVLLLLSDGKTYDYHTSIPTNCVYKLRADYNAPEYSFLIEYDLMGSITNGYHFKSNGKFTFRLATQIEKQAYIDNKNRPIKLKDIKYDILVNNYILY